jgi:hypothetical protein
VKQKPRGFVIRAEHPVQRIRPVRAASLCWSI